LTSEIVYRCKNTGCEITAGVNDTGGQLAKPISKINFERLTVFLWHLTFGKNNRLFSVIAIQQTLKKHF
jgi:hypothetical protein